MTNHLFDGLFNQVDIAKDLAVLPEPVRCPLAVVFLLWGLVSGLPLLGPVSGLPLLGLVCLCLCLGRGLGSLQMEERLCWSLIQW